MRGFAGLVTVVALLGCRPAVPTQVHLYVPAEDIGRLPVDDGEISPSDGLPVEPVVFIPREDAGRGIKVGPRGRLDEER